jgi:crotonobetainyl-CoA:carnitine CoA-transferase CaiB-like acyl-CoA transferase
LTEILDSIFCAKPMSHWQKLLEGAVPVAPVYELDQALDNPWLDAIGMKNKVDHPDMVDMTVLASPIKVNGERLPSKAGPLLGQDSDVILGEIGYDPDAIASLRQSGVI